MIFKGSWMIIKKDLTLKLLTTGQDVLQKLQRLHYDAVIRASEKAQNCLRRGKQIEYVMGSCRSCGTERPR